MTNQCRYYNRYNRGNITLLVALLACVILMSSMVASEDVEPTWQVQIAKAREVMDPQYHSNQLQQQHNNHHNNNPNNAESRKTRQLKPSKGSSGGNGKETRKKVPTAPPTQRPTSFPTLSDPNLATLSDPNLATPSDPNAFQSFFEIELDTLDGNPTQEELNAAVQLFVESYNGLKSNAFADPLERTMVDAQLVSTTNTRRRRLGANGRRLQNLNIFIFLRVSGTCRGCSNNPFFTNQVVGRRHNRRKLFDPPVNSMRAGTPSEAETLRAFSQSLQSAEVGSIVDALSLDELSSLPTAAPTMMPTIGKGSSSRSSKGSKGGKGGKGASKGASSTVVTTGNTLTSFMAVEFQTSGTPTDTEVQRAATAMVGWYNDLTGDQFVDPLERQITSMEVVTTRRRRLSRNLQNLNIAVFLRVSGTCRGCRNNAFFTNQVVGRHLFDKPVSEDLQDGVPTEAQFLEWCSDRIVENEEMLLETIVDMVSLDEVESIPTTSSSSKSSKKSGKGTSSSMRLTSPPVPSGARVSVSSVSVSFPVVQVQMAGQEEDEKCMSYTPGSDSITVEACSSDAAAGANDHWEVVSQSSSSAFALRHLNSQLCLPQNPNAPGSTFDCFVGSANAQAQRITGLVDCTASENVATMGFTDSYDKTALFLQECASGSSPGADTDIILMSYTEEETSEDVVVWGEKIMLDLDGIVSDRGMKGSWTLKEL